MIQKVGLVIPEASQALIDAGKLVRTDGVLRNAETMEIFKHLDIVDLEDMSALQELTAAVKRVVKENKKEVTIGLAVIVAIGVTAGVVIHNKNEKKRTSEEKCNAFLNSAIKNYMEAAQNGNLDIDTIEICEDALLSLPQITKKVFISMTREQIMEFTNALKEYTIKLAEENDYEVEDESIIEYKDNVISFIVNNLRVQKKILQKCA